MSRDLKRKDVKKRAENAIEGNSVIQLSLEGQLAFAEALLNPPEPNAALRRAFKNHAAFFGTRSCTQNRISVLRIRL